MPNESKQKAPFTIVVFGTDDQARCGDQKSDRPCGNTLTALLQSTSPNSVSIAGPSTEGLQVGRNQGAILANMLKEMANGNSEFYIAAHSRGACQTLVALQILEQLKTKVITLNAQGKSLTFDELIDSVLPSGYFSNDSTAEELKRLMSVNSKKNFMRNATESLKELKVTTDLIDPVPGIGLRGMIKWNDNRMVQPLPDWVSGSVVYARDERDASFHPVDVNGQHIKKYSLPGHHGTANGSQGAHIDAPLKSDRALIQELTTKLFVMDSMLAGITPDFHVPLRKEQDEYFKKMQQFIEMTPQEKKKNIASLKKQIETIDQNSDTFTGLRDDGYAPKKALKDDSNRPRPLWTAETYNEFFRWQNMTGARNSSDIKLDTSTQLSTLIPDHLKCPTFTGEKSAKLYSEANEIMDIIAPLSEAFELIQSDLIGKKGSAFHVEQDYRIVNGHGTDLWRQISQLTELAKEINTEEKVTNYSKRLKTISNNLKLISNSIIADSDLHYLHAASIKIDSAIIKINYARLGQDSFTSSATPNTEQEKAENPTNTSPLQKLKNFGQYLIGLGSSVKPEQTNTVSAPNKQG